MFNRSKLQKPEGVKPTELEEETAKALLALEHQSKDQAETQQALRLVYINSAKEVEYEANDGSSQKYILVRIPYRSLMFYKKVQNAVIEHLESQFKWPVIVVATRTIESKRAKTHASQKRPRSRTLKAVHAAVLNDIVVPSSIVGRQQKVSATLGTQEKVFLDPLDKHLVEDKLEAMADAYASLSTHKITLEFAKPTSFQKEKLQKLQQRTAQ